MSGAATSCEQSKGLALGERVKTTECCFYEVKSTKQRAVGAICDCDARRLCDLTGGEAEDVAGSNPEPSIRVSHSFVCASLDSLCSHSVDFALKKQLSTVFSLLTFRPKGASKRYSFFICYRQIRFFLIVILALTIMIFPLKYPNVCDIIIL